MLVEKIHIKYMSEQFRGFNPDEEQFNRSTEEKLSLIKKMARSRIGKAAIFGVGALMGAGAEGCSEDKNSQQPQTFEEYVESQADQTPDDGECLWESGKEFVYTHALGDELAKEVRGNREMTAELKRIMKSEAAISYAVQYSASVKGLEKRFDRVLHDEEYRIKVNDLIKKYCDEFQVPYDVAYGVAANESGFDIDKVSSVGARGIFQLMDNTSSDKKLQLPGADFLENNIYGGVKYLRTLYDRYGQWSIAMTAYSTGPNSFNNKLKNNSVLDYVGEHGNDQGHWRKELRDKDINAVTLYSAKGFGLGGSHPFQYPFYVLAVQKTAMKIMQGEMKSGELEDLVSPEDFRSICEQYPQVKSRIQNKISNKNEREIFTRLKIE